MQIRPNPHLATIFPQTLTKPSTSIMLKREHRGSSLVISPLQTTAAKIQKLPLEQNQANYLPKPATVISETSLTNKLNNESQVDVAPIEQLCQEMPNNNNKQSSTESEETRKLLNGSTERGKQQVNVQPQTSPFETPTASPVFNNINRLNEALIAINPR